MKLGLVDSRQIDPGGEGVAVGREGTIPAGAQEPAGLQSARSRAGPAGQTKRCLLAHRTSTDGFDLGSSTWMHSALWELAPQGNRAMMEKRMRLA